MRKFTVIFYIITLLGITHSARALTPNEAEDLADLTAVFIYLKYDCGYTQIPDREIERAIVYFARSNKGFRGLRFTPNDCFEQRELQ